MSLINIKILSETLYKYYEQENAQKKGDVGIDLYQPYDIIVPKKKMTYIKLGISYEVIEEGINIASFLLPRSSISKTPLRLVNSMGVIDAGYRGELIAAVDNISDEDYEIKEGVRLFQLVLFRVIDPNNFRINIVTELSETERGIGGFGSTGH
jgi:dUTP pyrophosphatase